MSSPRNLSCPLDELIASSKPGSVIYQSDVVIVGSGYGGAVSALQLANKQQRVLILERGQEYHPGDFPYDLGEMPGDLGVTRSGAGAGLGYSDALYDLRIDDEVDILVGNGLGGTSLINANVAYEPDLELFQEPEWPKAIRDDPSGLMDSFAAVRGLLQPQTSPVEHEKTKALFRLASHIPNCEAKLADITVSFKSGLNKHGVHQSACTACGNCISGCNVGAKNTLMMNAIPLAVERGADFYTNATVVSVERVQVSKWRLTCTTTKQQAGAINKPVWYIDTDVVILAAGTLGSTEIMLRSQALNESLKFSKQLGSNFSTNGDGLAMSFGQTQPVNATSDINQQNPAQEIGPTITAIAQFNLDPDLKPRRPRPDKKRIRKVTLEDGAVPAALTGVYGEMTTTAAQVSRIGTSKVPAVFTSTNSDPLCANRNLVKHSQVLLLMGDDGASGELSLDRDSSVDLIDRRVRIGWKKNQDEEFSIANNETLKRADLVLTAQDNAAGFDGGQYLANPLWRAIPPGGGDVLSGGAPKSRVITVHPLGGCGMGDDIHSGVVNHWGEVFDAGSSDGSSVHSGLYISDGAIMPRAVEVNPFLTISAFAWRNANEIRRRKSWSESDVQLVSDQYAYPPVRNPYSEAPAGESIPAGVQSAENVTLKIKEQLYGELRGDRDWLMSRFGQQSARWFESDGLVVLITGETTDANAWLDNPGQQDIANCRIELHCHPLSVADVDVVKPYGVAEETLGKSTLVAEGKGRIRMLEADAPWQPVLHYRALLALLTYHVRRKEYAKDNLSNSETPWLQRVLTTTVSSTVTFVKEPGKKVRGALQFYKIAMNQANYRRIKYDFELQPDEQQETMRRIHFYGEKVLGFSFRLPRLMDALMHLPFVIRDGDHKTSGKLKVAGENLFLNGLINITKAPHVPGALTVALGFSSFFIRSLFETSFWEFAGLDTPENLRQPETTPRDQIVNKTVEGQKTAVRIEACTVPLKVKLTESDTNDGCNISITRYQGEGNPVLLIHGLAQGSQVFWTESMSKNMVQYFLEKDYDVWVVDLRLSNCFIQKNQSGNWSIEEIARYDLASAIDHVFDKSGQQKISVFAHCVGAIALEMGILNGWLDADKLSKVAINAIHPWVVPSPANKARSKLGSLFRMLISDDQLDPIPKRGDGFGRSLIDRAAFAVSRLNEGDTEQHCRAGSSNYINAICDRMTLLYGRMWNHKNLSIKTHDAFYDMLGAAPASVYRHLYYLSLRGRVVDVNGSNRFLTIDKVRKHWTMPTLFIHGEDSRVFNSYSATRSAARLAEILRGNEQTPEVERIRNPKVGRKIYKGYGHMDVIIGDEAHRCVFEDLEYFFRVEDMKAEWLDARDPGDVDESLTHGPQIRGASLRDPGSVKQVVLRLWGQVNQGLAKPQSYLDVVAPHEKLEEFSPVPNVAVVPGRIVIQPSGIESRQRLIDVALSPTAEDRLLVHGMGDDPDNVEGQFALDLGKAPWLQRLKTRETTSDFNFLVGSCRFPDTMVDGALSDAIFAPMADMVSSKTQAIDMVLMLGDQIYVDAIDQLLPISSFREKYRTKYEHAYNRQTSPNFARLVATVPTHYLIDDHEIIDNWSGLPTDSDVKSTKTDARLNTFSVRTEYAKLNAHLFQGSGRNLHSFNAGTRGSVRQPESGHYYALSNSESPCPMVLLDTRTERQYREEKTRANYAICADEQWSMLEHWLLQSQKEYPDMPKFIGCGSTIAPVSRYSSSYPESWWSADNWLGYPASLGKLIRTIVDNEVKHVVFISGDAHFSALANLKLTNGDSSMRAWQLVASGFYTPLPFTNSRPHDFDWNTPVKASADEPSTYLTADSGLITTNQSHFVRVGCEKVGRSDLVVESQPNWRLSIEAFDNKGESIAPMGQQPNAKTGEPDGNAWLIDLE